MGVVMTPPQEKEKEKEHAVNLFADCLPFKRDRLHSGDRSLRNCYLVSFKHLRDR